MCTWALRLAITSVLKSRSFWIWSSLVASATEPMPATWRSSGCSAKNACSCCCSSSSVMSTSFGLLVLRHLTCSIRKDASEHKDWTANYKPLGTLESIYA